MARTKRTAGRGGRGGPDRLSAAAILSSAKMSNGGVKPDHENDFENLLDDLSKKGRAAADVDGGDEDDVRGKGKKADADDSDESDEDKFDFDSKRNRHGRNRRGEEEEEEESPYMLFDFRRGKEKWPSNVEMVDAKRYEELLLAATAAAEAAAKNKKKAGGEGDEDGEYPAPGGSPSGKGKGKSGGSVSWGSWGFDEEDKTEESTNKRDICPEDAVFETLGDGSTALILPPGYRLKINCEELLKGGDKKREERMKEAAKAKRRKAKYRSSWGGFGNTGTSTGAGWDDWDSKKFGYSKEYINQYTITMDIKLLEEPGREGLALYQTALIHSKESKRQGGKLTLSKSDGECFINQVGGVGTFGTFGDTTKARVKKGQWQRVVISVNCPDDANTKGEMRTWVGVEPGVILKEEAFAANERFAIDPENLYFFSSAQSSMMPGNIAIRMIRIDQRISTDVDVKSFRARDKLISKFDEDRQKEVEEQRKGLSLAPLFAKPRPMWFAPAFSAFFGDAFIERSSLEASSLLPWSYEVLNFALQSLHKNALLRSSEFGLSYQTRVAMSDSIHVLQQSALVFKHMMKLLKTPTESQLLSFLRKLKQCVQGVNTGETLLLPMLIEGQELLMILERSTERMFRVIIVQTDAYNGLQYHATNLNTKEPNPMAIQYRNCLVINNVPKKNVFDDVFWMACYNMTIHRHENDMHKFYDVLLPFLTGKSLETSLVEAEEAAAKGTDNYGSFGEWRLPQRSRTAYVRVFWEAFYYLLKKRNVSDLSVMQIHLAYSSELVKMMQNDLLYMLPNHNGVKICELAIKELSHYAVQFVDTMRTTGNTKLEGPADEAKESSSDKPSTEFILEFIHSQISSAKECLSLFADGAMTELPPELSLHRAKNPSDANDPDVVQFRDLLSWEGHITDPDPGQSISLKKYIPINLLQIPQKATTRRQAIEAIRRLDRLCTLIDNQSHCIKNDKLLIVTLIEHVFTHVVPVPKPRGVRLSKEDRHRSERAQRRAKVKEEEKKAEEEEKKKVQDEIKKKRNRGKGDAKANEDEENKPSTVIEYLGEEVAQQFEEGASFETAYILTDCIWDGEIDYELQVELLLTLQRICEHFVASAMSTQQSRPFDAVCITVPGVIAAIADVVMHKLAVDEPSECCAHLLGLTVEGRQLGHTGYGIGVNHFASQSETIEIHYPELAIARTAVLDYFQSPYQRRLEKIFNWEENYVLSPGKSMISYLRHMGREIGQPVLRPHLWLLDNLPTTSEIMKQYPELRCYRDVVFWWKYLLNPDRKVFLNFIAIGEDDGTGGGRGRGGREIQRQPRMNAQLVFQWNEQEGGYQVTAFGGHELRCKPDPKQVNPLTGKVLPPDQLPTHRFPSIATPSYFLPPPSIRTEDDVIYRPNLPSFAAEDSSSANKSSSNNQQVLNQRDSELLLSYLTVPYMRIPLILTFFASEDRIHKLSSLTLRTILDSVLFEPGNYLRMDMHDVEPTMVPTPHKDLLASPYGLLFNELCRAPDTVIQAVVALLRGALACDTGSVIDSMNDDDEGEGDDKDEVEDEEDGGHEQHQFNTSTTIILYVTRLAARVCNYLSFLIKNYRISSKQLLKPQSSVNTPLRDGQEDSIRDQDYEMLCHGLDALHRVLDEEVNTLFDDYLRRLDLETNNATSKTGSDKTSTSDDGGHKMEKLIDLHSRLACDLHSHKLLLYRNVEEAKLTQPMVKTMLGSFVYLTTRHTWNKTSLVSTSFYSSTAFITTGPNAASASTMAALKKSGAAKQGFAEGGRLQMPETEIYECLQVTRRRVINWLRQCTQGPLDDVMQTVLQISSSITGSFRTHGVSSNNGGATPGGKSPKDNSAISTMVAGGAAGNRWSRIRGSHSIGRWAVGSTRTLAGNESGAKSSISLAPPPPPTSGGPLSLAVPSLKRPVLDRQRSFDEEVGEVLDNGMLGVEIDVQIGQMTLRSKHLAALPSDVANHPDVLSIFGDVTIQASLIQSAENCDRYRLVGLNHELEYWKTPHNICPPLGDQWEREYDPAELAPETEGWIATLFEPIRKSFFDGPNPPPMQFLMTARATPATAEVAVMLGLHQQLGGPFKLVYLFKKLRCIHIYECVSQGRQWFYSLHFTTDHRYTMRDMMPSTENRRSQFPEWWIRGSGNAYPCGVHGSLMNDIDLLSRKPSLSVLVVRDSQHPANLSGGQETFVPARLLYGVVPEALLDGYTFWQDESIFPKEGHQQGLTPTDFPAGIKCYQRLRGYPRKGSGKSTGGDAGEYMIFVEFIHIGKYDAASTASFLLTSSDPTSYYQTTGFPGRVVRITRRPLSLVKQWFEIRQKIAHHIESLPGPLLLLPSSALDKKSKKEKKEEKAKQGDGKAGSGSRSHKFPIDTEVECDHEGNGEYWPCIVRRCNDDGSYDIEFVKDFKWLGTQKSIDARTIQRRGDSDRKRRGEGIWHWEGMSDSEEEDWREDDSTGPSDEDNEDEDEHDFLNGDGGGRKKVNSLPFVYFDGLDELVYTTASVAEEPLTQRTIDSVQKLLSTLYNMKHSQQRAAGKSAEPSPYPSIHTLVMDVKTLIEQRPDLLRPALPIALDGVSTPLTREDGNDMFFLNLLYAPHTSRLYSIMKVLTRIENVSFIVPWTKSRSSVAGVATRVNGVERGCPSLDLIELPRLKLSFTCRKDHDGVERMYSVDHVDLYISNDHLVDQSGSATNYGKMLQGIPHSLIMSNIRGETQLLVPVIEPVRPMIGDEPFSTFIVLNRNALHKQAERYFLYPFHISYSFLMTKGVNSALYLMLLRFLSRNYHDCYRLIDSIATDTEYNAEGFNIYQSFGITLTDDFHPDAHACRLRITLVTMDSGMALPWDITTEVSKYVIKHDRVSITCRLSLQEELQIVDSEWIVTSPEDKHYQEDIHNEYAMSVVYNRRQYLRALLTGSPTSSLSITDASSCSALEVTCKLPGRAITTNWSYYQDNTVFGEKYQGMREITSVNGEGEGSWKSEVLGLDETDAPAGKGGWLVVAVFHALWSATCLKVIPLLQDLVPIYQDHVPFLSVKADQTGMSALAKQFNITSFPAIILFRGGKEIDRIETTLGGDGSLNNGRIVERLVRVLNSTITDEDKLARAKYRHRVRLEKAKELGLITNEEEEIGKDGEQDLDWTFDPEQCGPAMRIENDGMLVVYDEEGIRSTLDKKEDNDELERAGIVWEYRNNTGSRNYERWKPFTKEGQNKLEKFYKTGKLYSNGYMYMSEAEVYVNSDRLKISDYEVSGFTGTIFPSYDDIEVRRYGERGGMQVPNEDQYLTKDQRERDRRAAQWKESMRQHQAKMKEERERRGEDVESIRGTVGFMKLTGKFNWQYQWNHEPSRGGICDAVGICSELKESFTATTAPTIGGSADGGISLALYADGSLYHNGTLLKKITPIVDRSVKTEITESATDSTEPSTVPKEEAVASTSDVEETKTPAAPDASVGPQTSDGSEEKKEATTEDTDEIAKLMANVGTPVKACLFGRQSVVRLEFDTDLDGGTLRFYIDAQLLEQATITNVFSLLSSAEEIYPVIAFSPLDSKLVETRKQAQVHYLEKKREDARINALREKRRKRREREEREERGETVSEGEEEEGEEQPDEEEGDDEDNEDNDEEDEDNDEDGNRKKKEKSDKDKPKAYNHLKMQSALAKDVDKLDPELFDIFPSVSLLLNTTGAPQKSSENENVPSEEKKEEQTEIDEAQKNADIKPEEEKETSEGESKPTEDGEENARQNEDGEESDEATAAAAAQNDNVVTLETPIERIRWMYEDPQIGWIVYSLEASMVLEEAHRDGKSTYQVTVGKGDNKSAGQEIHRCNLEKMVMSREGIVAGEPSGDNEEDNDGGDGGNKGECKLRKHVLSPEDSDERLWELLCMKFEKPHGLMGQGIVKIFEKVWAGNEDLRGSSCGLGFLFLYNLLTNESRCRILGSSYSSYSSYGSSYGGGGSSDWPSLSSFSAFGSGGASYGPTNYGKSSGGYGGYSYGGSSMGNDSHRMAILLGQLMKDRHSKSLPASIVNVLCRNRQVSLKMPKFKDGKKGSSGGNHGNNNRAGNFFNGWSDGSDGSGGRSPLADLFSKLVPIMKTLKRKKALHFPPPPPYPELAPSATKVSLDVNPSEAAVTGIPEITDYACDRRVVRPVPLEAIESLMTTSGYQVNNDIHKPQPPRHVLDHRIFDDLCSNKALGKLVIVDFFATWCSPCKALAPIFHMLAMKTPSNLAYFLKVDVEECEELAQRFQIQSMPTTVFLRCCADEEATGSCTAGGCTSASCGSIGAVKIVGMIKGGGPTYLDQFAATLQKVFSEEELLEFKRYNDKDDGDSIENTDSDMAKTHALLVTPAGDLQTLAQQPLADCNTFFTTTHPSLANGTGSRIDETLAFDLTKHSAAQSAPARAILARFRDDVKAFASFANESAIIEMNSLSLQTIKQFFASNNSDLMTSREELDKALISTRNLHTALNHLKEMDHRFVQEIIPLLTHLVNHVPLNKSDDQKEQKLHYLLRRESGASTKIWIEFLFASLISTQGIEDLKRLNPYLTSVGCLPDEVMHMISLCMLRANRLGHTNRCIGSVISLEKLLQTVLSLDANKVSTQGDVYVPKLIQLSEDVCKTVTMGRYFMKTVSDVASGYEFDPRYLVFEFVWNIQLRKKQVEIVDDFRHSLAHNHSKVKQMIMGAGKTSVVAPLLALILADGKSLVLSVVPKALVEMSRTRLRETFASIMTKRVYTLEFDRSTVVKPSMRKHLENARLNRGVVVATPTTLKSIMLSYIEVLRHMQDLVSTQPELLLALTKERGNTSNGSEMLSSALASSEKGRQYMTQAKELREVLTIFQEGIMLLDEVDLILHPLKSELNFPIGEKFDLDGSDEGERWDLPIHLFDAFVSSSTSALVGASNGPVNPVATSGGQGRSAVASAILQQIAAKIALGIDQRSLQRLPHITLLNKDFYHAELKPLLAEWTYLWLQQKHLHGITHHEAINYLLLPDGGLVSKADLWVMSELIEEELQKAPTNFHLQTGLKSLKAQYELVEDMYNLDQSLDQLATDHGEALADVTAAMSKIQKRITDIESPRDDSLDNSIIVWCSQAFVAGGNSSSLDGSHSSSGSANDSSVLMVCSALEDMGFTIRRSGDHEEAIAIAKTLYSEGQLRCLIVGGDESGALCGPGCIKRHRGRCQRCGEDFSSHSGHECPSGGRGAWLLEDHHHKQGSDKKISHQELIKKASKSTPTVTGIPVQRVGIYSAHAPPSEADRLVLWQLNARVLDGSKEVLQWVSNLIGNGSDEEGQANTTDEDESSGSETEAEKSAKAENSEDEEAKVKAELQSLKSELESLEAKRLSLQENDEVARKRLQTSLVEKYHVLEESIQQRLSLLHNYETRIMAKVPESTSIVTVNTFNGVNCGRDACLAMEWSDSGEVTDVSVTLKHLQAVQEDVKFFEHLLLVMKLLSFVTSSHHKKLLNLAYQWLQTFLPHCLAKVNRVSFGLLSRKDCQHALEIDPFVPRSRLKLAVPFIGKDVPSRSSEFAHPDIIIGLTVLAYRYSGLRQDDFIDIIDRMTAQFSMEIGPARDRESSMRHEKWVYESGGAIRGLKTNKDGQQWKLLANAPQDMDEEEQERQEELRSRKEVVQLKFLQKSNKEQMDKLFDLIRYEPMTVHYYLQTMIFPQYMRSQRVKLSASGQAIGGDMLVGRRVGFSGTPSDLLPQELGKCDYETGDDGMMLSTCLNRDIASYEFIQSGWDVDLILESIANPKGATSRYHALIDTGALITGYSNYEVARKLLEKGLPWCDGVVYLDEDDRQQVLVRATGRVVSADQCGISLEKRFAFYDQIHTTGMDIKHVVNATAVITLGKDMVFRDYVQGAYRMRGIGVGQKIHVYIIPEVKELMNRELTHSVSFEAKKGSEDHVLEDIVAWLIINSLRSEHTQWAMLCIQNIGNIYRKNAFKCVHKHLQFFTGDEIKHIEEDAFVDNLDRAKALEIFSEPIDFSLDAGVPEPIPFDQKLRRMLTAHDDFVRRPEQESIADQIMHTVCQFTMAAGASGSQGAHHRLDTEQEREQEQEQEKEVEQRRDQQIEIEKFVEREYSRQEESQRPWPFKVLGTRAPPKATASLTDMDNQFPFYPLSHFQLKHHNISLSFPRSLYVSRNFFNLDWTGLRRIKNVVMLLEYTPSLKEMRWKTAEDFAEEDKEDTSGLNSGSRRMCCSDDQWQALSKAFDLFSAASAQGTQAYGSEAKARSLSREELECAITAMTDEEVPTDMLNRIFQDYSSSSAMTFDGFKALLRSGLLTPEHQGRYWVAVSLAEAETMRRILHIRRKKAHSTAALALRGGATPTGSPVDTELALHYSPIVVSSQQQSGPGSTGQQGGALSPVVLTGSNGAPPSQGQKEREGVIFDTSLGWDAHSRRGRNRHRYEQQVAYSCFRFFDCDMHYTTASLNILIKVLHGNGGTAAAMSSPTMSASMMSLKEKEQFFLSLIGIKRRLERKWQETPLSKVFTVSNQWIALKHRALGIFFLQALLEKAKKSGKAMSLWEAFTAFDSDNNGLLGPSEFYAALRFLEMPASMTSEDVVDCFEAIDRNRDGFIDYREYTEFFANCCYSCSSAGLSGSLSKLLMALEDSAIVASGSSSASSASASDDEQEDGQESKTSSKTKTKLNFDKIPPYGAEELREIILRRKQEEQQRLREEKLRKAAYQQALDTQIFEDELEASKSRKGGQNPLILRNISRCQLTPAHVPAVVTSTVEGSESAATVSEEAVEDKKWTITNYHFTTNQLPLRFHSNSGNNQSQQTGGNAKGCQFYPINHGTAFDKPIKPMTCKKGHNLTACSYYWMNCSLCKQRETAHVCWNCSQFICATCYDGHRIGKERDRRDPAKHPTFLRCSSTSSTSGMTASSFTLQIPRNGGANQVTEDFTFSMEVRFPKLPAAASGGNQQQLFSVVRFSSLADSVQSAHASGHGHRTSAAAAAASLYLASDGSILPAPHHQSKENKAVPPAVVPTVEKEGQDEVKEGESAESTTIEENVEAKEESKPEGETVGEEKKDDETKKESEDNKKVPEGPKLPKIRANTWAIVTVSVRPSQGTIAVFINGEVALSLEGLDAAELKLQQRIVVFGGGKVAHSRGGDVRRIVFHSDAMSDEEARKLFLTLADESDVFGYSAKRIQAVYRGFICRRHLQKEKEAEQERIRLEEEEERKKEEEEKAAKLKEKEGEEGKEQKEGETEGEKDQSGDNSTEEKEIHESTSVSTQNDVNEEKEQKEKSSE